MSETAAPLTTKEVALFAERIAKSLALHPLEIGMAAHRQQVAEALRRIGQGTFYHFLAIGPGSRLSEIHQAYERLARLVHPSHADRLGWEEEQKNVLAMVFEHATRAYLALSDPERRKAYDREFGGDAPPSLPGAPARQEENRLRARESFRRAQALAQADEIHYAVELVREAVRIDPQAEYFTLLGDLLVRNERWLAQALDAYRKALELGNVDPRLLVTIRELRARISGEPAAKEEAKAGGGRLKRFFGQRS